MTTCHGMDEGKNALDGSSDPLKYFWKHVDGLFNEKWTKLETNNYACYMINEKPLDAFTVHTNEKCIQVSFPVAVKSPYYKPVLYKTKFKSHVHKIDDVLVYIRKRLNDYENI